MLEQTLFDCWLLKPQLQADALVIISPLRGIITKSPGLVP